MENSKSNLEKGLYGLEGIIEYNEQMILLTGKVIIYSKPNDAKFYAIGKIKETPGDITYFVEGDLSDLHKDNKMALDIMQTPLDIDAANVSYYMTQDYSKVKEKHIPIAGRYDGIRRDDMFKDLLEDDSKPIEDRVHEMVTNLTTTIDQKIKIVAMSLSYKGLITSISAIKELVPPDFTFS